MFDRLSRSRRQHDALLADQAEVDRIVTAWENACEGADLTRAVPTVSGPTIVIPRVVDLTLGPPLQFIVRLLPGQLSADVAAVGHRIAPWLGGRRLRVIPCNGGTYARIEVLAVDPLDRLVPPPPAVESVLCPVRLGEDEHGRPVEVALPAAMHLILQGASGSGKSVGCYSLLAQLPRAEDVLVAGSDITGLLLKPWADHARSRGWQTTGTAQPAKHVEVLERLVAMMDGRVADLPARRDTVAIGPAVPLVVVVLEEFPGMLRLLRTKDKALEARARNAAGRLLAEGRKAGMRVLIVAQRADADIIGGYERGQASHTISFRVDSMAALRMLHADVAPELAAAHATAPPGVALLSAPGAPLTRFRAPLTSFDAYCDAVEAGGRAAA